MKILKSYSKVPLVAFCVFLYVSIMQIFSLSSDTDTDLYFLIGNGWEVLRNRAVPHELFNTIHDGFHTIMQQWAMSVVDAMAYNIAGYIGIKVVSLLGYVVSVLICYLYIRENVNDKSHRFLAISLVSFPFCYFMNGRPWEASVCMLCAFVYFSEKYCKTKNWKWLISWPVFSVLLSNFQAALWGLLLCFGLTYVCPNLMVFKTVSTIKKGLIPELKSKKVMWLFYFLMIPFACINPNGFENITYLINSYGTTSANARITISEMAEPVIMSVSGVSVLIGALFLLYYIKKNWDKCEWKDVYLAIGCLALGVMHLRNVWISSLGCMPIICSVLNDWDKEEESSIKSENKIVKCLARFSDKVVSKGIISVVLITVIISVVSMIAFLAMGRNHDVDGGRTPVLAADYLDKVDDDIVLFTGFNNGAYLRFRGYDVYFHAQPELYGKAVNGKRDIYEEYQNLILEPDFDYESFIDSYGFNYLCVDKNGNLYTYLKYNQDYEIVVDSEEYALVKKHS